MSTLILTIILFGILTAREIPKLKRKNEKKEWFVFALLMVIGLTLSVMFVFHMTVKVDFPG